MEAALIAHLLATAGITAVVGQRITWGRRDQGGALPAIVLHRIDGAPDYHLTGASGLVESRVQVDCWGSSYGSAKSVARTVDTALSAARFTQGAVRFDAILIVDERDDTFDETATAIFRTSLDLQVHHARAS
ncbi:MAG: DUF3168 domain-containing protein [Brevundimonas sp.]|nr:MAG: DUF3168 domain-containing protein [Brevundimonas sp.]